MFIYLAAGLLQQSSDLTRSDTDVFSVGASNSRIGTYLVLLHAEIGRLTLLRLREADSSLSSDPHLAVGGH